MKTPEKTVKAAHEERLAELEHAIGYRFRDPVLLSRALTHSSAVNERAGKGAGDNQRLEFLGDAVLGLLVARLLVERYPDMREGELSRLRGSLVNERHLATLAAGLSLGSYLLMGKGEEKTGGRQRRSILADTYEALLAAVYLDGGIEAASARVLADFTPLLEERRELVADCKTKLQEKAQALGRGLPRYEVVGVEGPPHHRRYTVQVFLGDEPVGRGEGGSKKEAEQAAARAAAGCLCEIP